jgi:hypothetical protein
MEKKDLTPYKNKLNELSYEDKMEMSEWLHSQIELDRAAAIKEKAKKVEGQMDSFLTKANNTLKDTGNSILSTFRSMGKTEDTTKK